ncbi:MAG: flagellar biosynthesis protein FlhB [Candidatus Gastranaerophilales bacterium]|nr:flagellar biosynthesis protein FlhB [Candidatus Gastranaerophilales bacterium]
MSSERTEAATPRKRNEERKKGNISKSQDLSSALTLSVALGLLVAMSGMIMSDLQALLYDTFTHLNPKTIESKNILALMEPYAIATAKIVLPFLVTLMIFAAIVIRLQVGALFAPEKIKPDIKKFSPSQIVSSLKKMLNPFEVRNMVELSKNLLKVAIVGGVGYSVFNSRKDELFGLVGSDVTVAFPVMGSILVNMLINMCVVMLIMGLIDRKYQDYEYEKSIKMTKQEVKDEFKNMEGDPKIKQKIKAAQMQMMKQKMMANIPQADVVVTNPTHYAVAIKYDRVNSVAPMVVAKGVDYMAFKIREIAQNNHVPIVENKPLARSLYKLVPVDGMIPADLYVAVAEVLAYVYNKNKGKN